MRYRPFTKNGHNLWDVLSLLQKSIRRNDKRWAVWAANELDSKYHDTAWKRLLIISCEDVGELVTTQVLKNMRAAFHANKELPSHQISHARWLVETVLLLCDAVKSRDCDNFIYVAYNNGNPSHDEINAQLSAITAEENAMYEKFLAQHKKTHVIFPDSADDYLLMDQQLILHCETPLIPVKGNVTRSGHDVTAVLAVLARALDAKNPVMTGWAVCELDTGGYGCFMTIWNYLIDVATRTCANNDKICREAWSLLRMSAMLNARKKSGQVGCTLPLLKLAFVLCDETLNDRSTDRTLNQRDADRIVTDAEVTDALSNIEKPASEFPDYTWDVHTLRGKRMGKTSHTFLFSETFSLVPKSPDDKFDPIEGTDYSEVFMRVFGHA